jgi:putative efflux protein, MATE family
MKSNPSEKAERQFRKMTQTPVTRLIVSLSVPTVISMMVSNIYNIADTYFVSSIGTSASGAVGIVFALQAIIQAFGFMIGHGSGSLVSLSLGGKDIERAKKIASSAFFAALVFSGIIAVLGEIFITPLMILLGSTPTILPYATDYARYILLAAPLMCVSFVMNNILRYEGKAAFAMIGITFGGLLNVALDPLFIFTLKMGVAGAGLATALSQIVGAGLLLSMFLAGKTQSRFSLRYISKDVRDYLKIFRTGTPSLIRQGLNSIAAMLLNNAAGVYGDAAVAAMSIVGRVSFVVFAFGIGIGQGLQPVSSFNYGAKLYSRVRKGYIFTILYGTAVCAALSTAVFFFADFIIGKFREDPEVIAVGVPALKAQCVAMIVCMLYQCTNMLYQSIGKAGAATVLASLRNGICFIPMILLLPVLFGVNGIIFAQPVADFLAAGISLPFALHFIRSLPPDGEE